MHFKIDSWKYNIIERSRKMLTNTMRHMLRICR